jgi:hypothetical protein
VKSVIRCSISGWVAGARARLSEPGYIANLTAWNLVSLTKGRCSGTCSGLLTKNDMGSLYIKWRVYHTERLSLTDPTVKRAPKSEWVSKRVSSNQNPKFNQLILNLVQSLGCRRSPHAAYPSRPTPSARRPSHSPACCSTSRV